MAIDPDVAVLLDAQLARDAAQDSRIAVLELAADAAAGRLDLAELELLNVGNLTATLGGEQEVLASLMGQLAARVGALENGQLPPPPPERPEGLLYDSTLDTWGIWTAYGPGENETYGNANNSRHHHTPARVEVLPNDGRRLLATDEGVGTAKRFLTGCLSTREQGWFFGFGDAPTKGTIRFEVEMSVNEYSHCIWYAFWLRGKGGAGVHEVDMVEAFTAQTGVDRMTQIVHSAGAVNYIKAPWPYAHLPAGQTCTVWFECDRPGVSGPNAHIRMGIDDATNVDSQDNRSPLWWRDDYGWDMIAQIQNSGNWVGDALVNPYAGVLQNGRTGRPASEVPSWDGHSHMDMERVAVSAR